MLGQNPQGYLRAITSFTRNERPSSQSHPIKSGQNLNERVAKCTICREKEYLKNLCAPCECEGTKGFVHFTCVKAWAEASDSNRCPDCGHRLKLRIERTRTSFQRFMHRSDFGRLSTDLRSKAIPMGGNVDSVEYSISIGNRHSVDCLYDCSLSDVYDVEEYRLPYGSLKQINGTERIFDLR
ncbi:e3 ubiquitin-protein ligase MARCH3-like protein [Sarcoptes scabiei]|uniref:E3 ubiquitin-protein ligase MARCH3-like protein n=1 Tax=Sarcoptes scabiei TaxID=52283 RepID=A0A132AEI0_SARSC|nr:e3 ubiquitin-protein ligase MARCH3-like protein [Sarcoptes scabiei]